MEKGKLAKIADCSFCQKEIGQRALWRGKYCQVIFSNPRLMPGHLLVISERHVESLAELNEKERIEIFAALATWQERITQKIAGGCDIRQNYRPFQAESNLKKHHLHFHLQPRALFDQLYQKSQIHETELFQPLSREEQQKLTKLLA